ncbi:RdgB/HAM1 family non-canonical purine NTP pyrophosphatase [Thiomicrorhabdus sp. zzn3]|uniref:RdgB/HAM1 family non-canonical purine NTP pyrophosphatase n=1 Tax=Thiomicrorhabdus sp. zzn3 TaxID=3039775 RepID=UPI0024365FEC|nr:RdgB/HAM1 family non-canonical purine NTP pyrophosphatase [Thiomicrorhabdus sp. zzn3]MDG6778639.1 RdgB/HAM1 family non-canonical purine NTP pyrophosphatase [Thiomicrorhabdus sp. zzn3]
MKTLVLATGNPGKLKEMGEILQPLGWNVRPQKEFFSSEADETGLSFVENAILKARYACEQTGLPAIADDSGIEVNALHGRPGIYSARYAALDGGGNASDEANLQKLLQDMDDVPSCMRQASYYCAMAFCRFAEDPTPLIGLGRWQGEIGYEPKGDGGFGYDPIFNLPELGKTAAELSKEEKNHISHRAQALQALVQQIKAL